MTESVVSDSTFYIAFMSPDEIDNPKILTKILQKYRFHVGKVVLNEIAEKHGDVLDRIKFKELIRILNEYEYAALLSIIGDKIFEKGEYECMAIAHQLLKKSELHSLILDDNPARRFVERNIPDLLPFVKYSLRFVVDCCCVEEKITSDETLTVLHRVKEAINKGSRPFNLTEKNIDVINKLLDEVNGCQK